MNREEIEDVKEMYIPMELSERCHQMDEMDESELPLRLEYSCTVVIIQGQHLLVAKRPQETFSSLVHM